MWIIGHPKLKTQQISRVDCRITKSRQNGRNSFSHTCPTIGGSSGSPVFDASNGNVIGIAHAVDDAFDPKIGYGIPFSKIAEQSALFQKIVHEQ